MGLPSGYKRLEYIQSTGTQYINTGFAPNQSTRVVCDTVFAAVSVGAWLFGARHENTDRTFGFLTYQNNYRSDFDTSSDGTITETQSGRFTVDKDGNITKINGSTVKTATAGTFQCSHSLFLFANNNNGTVGGYGKATVYSCQIYDNGTLVRDFIPCRTPDGTVGLWDNVNSVFYTNAGTGAFIGGPISSVSLPSGYRRLEYIQSSGTQYIDTGFKPNQDTRTILDFNIYTYSAAGYVFGCRGGGSEGYNNRYGLMYNGTFRTDYGNGNGLTFSEALVHGDRHLIDKNKAVCTLDNERLTNTSTTFQSLYNMALFGVIEGGSAAYLMSVRVYSCQIYDNGLLVRDFIPCQTTSGEIGLWDDVNGVFYGNAGTGMFISGGYTSLKTGDILNYDYLGAVQSVTLPKGVYKLEVWGAQGGSSGSYGTTSTGGNGGYSIGIITLTAETVLHIYVGGQGTYSTTSGSFVAGGFNGGGKAGYRYGGSGGGASDIRIGTDSLYSRVIVAGGGGGGWSHSNYNGGVGGGTSGGQGAGYKPSFLAGAGTQTTGGAGNGYNSSYYGSDGAFGVGGNGASNSSSYNRSSGGGGGWYGGGGSGYRSSSSYYYRGGGGAGGGSGFVWTGSNAPSGYLLGPEYYLTDASTIAGNASMPSTSGGTETGHTGNGYARITVINIQSLNIPVNIGGTWKDMDLAYVNIGGTWKTVDAAYVNIGGTWKELS